MKFYAVRKRPIAGISKNKRSKRAVSGVVYVPNHLVGSKVMVMDEMEYAELRTYERKLQRIYGMVRNGIDG